MTAESIRVSVSSRGRVVPGWSASKLASDGEYFALAFDADNVGRPDRERGARLDDALFG